MKNTVSPTAEKSKSKVIKTFKECPKCASRNLIENLNSSSTCNKCNWRLFESYNSNVANGEKQVKSSPHSKSVKSVTDVNAPIIVRLAGVTYEGRQEILSEMRMTDKIKMKREKYNNYDENAIAVYNINDQNIGWIPKDIATALAPNIDAGEKYKIEINKIHGGNGYNYGVEVLINKMDNTLKSYQTHKHSSKSAKTFSENINSKPANKLFQKPEYIYLDSILTKSANQESLKEVHNVLADFIKYRDKTLPKLDRKNIEHLVIADLESLFDNTIMLAAGTESNFIHRHYKAILVQLSFQLGFLIHRLLPGSTYASYAQSKMSWLSTMDVRLETKALQPFFYENVVVSGNSPTIADTTVSDQIYFWDIEEINYVLSNLTDLGFEFKKFIKQY
ncbi:hypothetical protein AUC31_06840 [Planococcus rifietoensis]|uniref:HIRAN domain-containing protein n=1 Tax=Planococcus rifietoensis TaxID=200991 RepID=A0A0U2XFV3_9BACL|nr:hypothetical protein AUC31_06840 [Planococcus rifietoensis]